MRKTCNPIIQNTNINPEKAYKLSRLKPLQINERGVLNIHGTNENPKRVKTLVTFSLRPKISAMKL